MFEFRIHYIISGNIGGSTVIMAQDEMDAADIFEHTCFNIYKVVRVERIKNSGVKNHV